MTSTPEALNAAFDLARAYVNGLERCPVSHAADAATMAAILDEPLPDRGCPPADAVTEWFSGRSRASWRNRDRAILALSRVGRPRPPLRLWLASAIDQNPATWTMSPAAAQTELVVLRWLKELFGLPSEWAGAVTSGATMSNLVGLAAARQWAGNRLGFDPAQDGLGGNPRFPSSAAPRSSDRDQVARHARPRPRPGDQGGGAQRRHRSGRLSADLGGTPGRHRGRECRWGQRRGFDDLAGLAERALPSRGRLAPRLRGLRSLRRRLATIRPLDQGDRTGGLSWGRRPQMAQRAVR